MLVLARADAAATHYERVDLNMVQNAVHHTREGFVVRIELSPNGRETAVRVYTWIAAGVFGNAPRRRGSNERIVSAIAGSRNATDPGTHMITPASA
jgi:hypothetical protein